MAWDGRMDGRSEVMEETHDVGRNLEQRELREERREGAVQVEPPLSLSPSLSCSLALPPSLSCSLALPPSP
eukprot:2532706-Rhodomonas_salina.1